MSSNKKEDIQKYDSSEFREAHRSIPPNAATSTELDWRSAELSHKAIHRGAAAVQTQPTTIFSNIGTGLGSAGLMPARFNQAEHAYRSISSSQHQGALNFGVVPPLSKPMRNLNLQKKMGSLQISSTNTKDNAGQPAIRVLALPFFLEPYTHVFVKGNVEAIVANVENALEKEEVDFLFKKTKCKWKGIRYMRNWALHIRVQLFCDKNKSTENDKLYVLEFQRMDGCALQFASFYRAVINHLIKEGIVYDKDGVKVTKQCEEVDSAPFALPLKTNYNKKNEQPSHPKLTPKAFEPLFEMSKSNLLYVQRQAIICLANQANVRSAREAMIKIPGFLKQIVNLVDVQDQDVQRAAVVALGNFMSDENFQDAAKNCGGVTKLIKVGMSANLVETKRQTVIALSNLCSKDENKRYIRECGGAELLNSYVSDTDKRLAKLSNDMKTLISVTA